MSPSPGILVLSVREALREMRFAVRHEAGMIDRTIDAVGGSLKARAGSATADLPGLHRALRAIPTPGSSVLRLADAVFGRIEKAAVRAFSPDQDPRLYGSLGSVSTLVRPEAGVRRLDEGAFVRRHYRLAHDLLRTLGVVNLLLSEQAIGDACQRVQATNGDLAAVVSDRAADDLSATERAQRVGLCAAMALALERARPIRRLDLGSGKTTAQHLLLAPNLYVFSLIGLAEAVVSTAPPQDAAEVIEAAGTVVDVRFARIAAAVRARDPLAALTREFMAVVPHLP
ncbi:MAG TPA: hypothetical protein VH414_06265 [Lichenihabitans sp.]|jgi:hypothetical protein|nr:hypothetical protein [Lichenihabitans sp.]